MLTVLTFALFALAAVVSVKAIERTWREFGLSVFALRKQVTFPERDCVVRWAVSGTNANAPVRAAMRRPAARVHRVRAMPHRPLRDAA